MAEKNIDSYVVENEIVIEEPRVPQYTVEDSASIVITNPFRATSVHQEFHLPDRPRISASSIGPVRFSTPADIGQPIPKRRKRTTIDDCIGTAISGEPSNIAESTNTVAKQIQHNESSNDPMTSSEGALDMVQDDVSLDSDSLDMDLLMEHSAIIDDNILIPDMNVPGDDVDTTTMLYHGSNMSCFQATAILLSWFSRFPGMSKNSFTQLLGILHNQILPKGNTLPTSYAQAVTTLGAYITPVQEYHSCINDCILFRESHKDLDGCPVCGESRYKSNTQIPRKVFKYLPISNRIKRWYGNQHTSALLQSHKESIPARSTRVTHVKSIHESQAWQQLYGDDGEFGGEVRSLSFALCLDGTNPFAKEKYSYSMCPMLLVPLNLPQSLRSSARSVLLTGIIPGPAEVKNTDPYVDVLVDEILKLQNTPVYDALHDEEFNLQISITLNILDYPGQNKLFHCQGAGAYAGCAYCTIKGEYAKELNKMVYLKHRSFLPQDDLLRLSDSGFPNKRNKLAAPVMKSKDYIDNANAKYESASSAVEKKAILQETGCKGTYSLNRLPDHSRLYSTPVEPMHLFKNIGDHLVGLLSGRKDSVKVRNEEKSRKRFRPTWIGEDYRPSRPLPPAPFVFSNDEISIANQRSRSIQVPAWIDWKQKRLFAKSVHLKSVEWMHALASGILKYCVRGCLGNKQRQTLYEMCDVVAALSASAIDPSEVDSIEYRVSKVLSLLERDYPISIHVIVFHLLHHLPMYVRLYGPLRGFWMYPLERFNSWISHRVLNKRYPESTVIETYRLFEATSFLHISKQLPTSATPDVELDCEQDEVNEKEKVEEIVTVSLMKEQLKNLDRYYQDDIPDYSALIKRYNKEKAANNKITALREWTPSSGPTLTSADKAYMAGPTDQIQKFNVLTISHRCGRNIKYTSKESDKSRAGFSSSCVCTKAPVSGKVYFGRILFLFKHGFNGRFSNMACVNWFDGFSVDRESGLIHVKLDSTSTYNPICTLDRLSPPLIHAIDLDDPKKLWILNYHVSLLC